MANLSYLDFSDELTPLVTSVLQGPSIVNPAETRSLEDSPFTTGNVNVIFGFQPLRSFRPSRSFNTLTELEINKGILIDAKQSFDF